jgi:hypothetical protein
MQYQNQNKSQVQASNLDPMPKRQNFKREASKNSRNRSNVSAKSGRSANSAISWSSQNNPQDLGKKLDEEFVLYMLEVEQRY